ncbi:MAG: GAF domain-containing sensor histidine kinase [Chloroflexota bacterium]|nr:GAF domain-containing sensor histidine kinase [Chloroflexota bacterium]
MTQEMQDSPEALRHTVRLRALHEAALTIAASVSAEPEAVAKLLARVTRHAVDALEGQDGRLVLAENDVWQELVPESAPSEGLVLLVHGERLRRSPQRPHGVTAHVLASGKLVHVEDTLANAGHGPYPELAEVGIASFVVAPLVAGQRVLGALSVMFGEHRELADEDRDALRLFAAHAAAALERVRLAAERQAALHDLAKRDAEAVALRDLDRLRGNLLLMISHELRTPLTLIHGYAELLQARIGSLSPAGAQTMANRIHAASTQLARLMDDLFDFTRLQHGDVLGRPVVLDLVPVLEGVVDRFRDRQGGDSLVFQGAGPLFVRGNQERIMQALSNLLENALTYASDGPIVVRVVAAEPREPVSGPQGSSGLQGGSPAGEAGSDTTRVAAAVGGSRPEAWARVEVQDHGPGLPLDEQARVWESFFRGARVAGLNVAPGSGIGLAAVKAIVEAHGGAVGLQSDPGHGACFWFSLPLVA